MSINLFIHDEFKRTGTFQTITNSKWDTDNDDVFDEANSRRSQRSQSTRKSENYPTISQFALNKPEMNFPRPLTV